MLRGGEEVSVRVRVRARAMVRVAAVVTWKATGG